MPSRYKMREPAISLPSASLSTPPRPHLSFFVTWPLSLVALWRPLSVVISLSLADYRYSHVILIPPIAAFLIYWKRRSIFHAPRFCPRLGTPLAAIGIVLLYFGRPSTLNSETGVFVSALAIVVVWIACFLLSYGPQSFKAALFPLLFLLLFVPVPGSALDLIITGLQRGSAEMTQILYKTLGMPAFRQGFVFSLPGLTIEIAKECSSIRSGIALFVTGLLAGYAYIRSPWRRAFLSVLTIPIAMFTNAVRIVILSWLAVHVDSGYLEGNLHHRGGALFSLISVAVLIVAVFVLSEDKLRPPRRVSRT